MIFTFQPDPIEITAESRTEALEKLKPYMKMQYDWKCIKIATDNNVIGGD